MKTGTLKPKQWHSKARSIAAYNKSSRGATTQKGRTGFIVRLVTVLVIHRFYRAATFRILSYWFVHTVQAAGKHSQL